MGQAASSPDPSLSQREGPGDEASCTIYAWSLFIAAAATHEKQPVEWAGCGQLAHLFRSSLVRA